MKDLMNNYNELDEMLISFDELVALKYELFLTAIEADEFVPNHNNLPNIFAEWKRNLIGSEITDCVTHGVENFEIIDLEFILGLLFEHYTQNEKMIVCHNEVDTVKTDRNILANYLLDLCFKHKMSGFVYETND